MNRKIKLVSIDGDGCLFAYTNIGSAFHSSWDAVAFAYGLKEAWDERSVKYYQSPGKSNQWAEEDAADLRIPYSPGAREFLKASRGRLVRGLLSGCLDLVGKKAAVETELDFCHCNIMHVENGIFSGNFDQEVSPWEKHLLLPDICRQFNVAPEEICHVGDHENDIPVFDQVGLAVAFRPKLLEVGKMAKYVIDDFAELGPILGLD